MIKQQRSKHITEEQTTISRLTRNNKEKNENHYIIGIIVSGVSIQSQTSIKLVSAVDKQTPYDESTSF